MLVYSVRADLPDAAVRDEYLAWLQGDDHLGDVVRAGALDAEVIVLDEPNAIVTRYRFASRAAFAAYESGPAKALRAEGLARFGPERGIRMTRSLGELVASRP